MRGGVRSDKRIKEEVEVEGEFEGNGAVNVVTQINNGTDRIG